jgi:hypothetical protein
MRHLRLSLGHSVVLVGAVLAIVCNSGAAGADLGGVVLEVMGEKITIRIAPDLLPNPGDKVEVLNTVPDLGEIALDCEWQVESVQGGLVLAVTRDKSRAAAQPDYRAVIHSPNPRRLNATAPAVKGPPLPAKTPDQTPPAGVPGPKTSHPPSDPGGSVVEGILEQTPAGFGAKGPKPSAPPSEPGSSVVVGVFEPAPGAGGGVTLDDVVRVNRGVFRSREPASGPVVPPELQNEEPWAVQWQVHDTLADLPGGGRAGLYADVVRSGQANPSPGRRGVMYLHPRSAPEPVRLIQNTTLPGPSPVLKLGVCGNRSPDGDWLLVVKVDGARLGPERLVRGLDGWLDLTYDLSGFSTSWPVQLCVEAHANDWRCAYAFFDYLWIESVVPLPTPPDTPLELPGVKSDPVSQTVHVESVILSDDFNSENEGHGQRSYDGFGNWFVRSGEVDLVGRGFRDAYPDHGLYLDLDGGGYLASTLQSKGAFRLGAGVYQLEFDLAGHPERTANTVTVSLGGLYSESFTLNAKEPFRTIRRQIKVRQATNAALVFKHAGRDGAGLLLDNVRFLAVSSPSVTSAAPSQDRPGSRASTSPAASAYLGALVQRDANGCPVISEVTPRSPAAQAGLRKGDVLAQIEDRVLEGTVTAPDEWARIVSGLPLDRPVRFVIRRQGQRMDLWVRPAALGLRR